MVPDSQSSSRKGDVSPAAEPVMVRRDNGSGSGGLERGVSPLSPVARAVVREASSGPTEDPGGSPLLQRDTCE